MVVLMSRGDTGIIYGNDNKPLYLNEIFKVFNNKNCPSLQGKPKVFFIEACPGDPQRRVSSSGVRFFILTTFVTSGGGLRQEECILLRRST
ncbi:hypothetical protein HPB48_013456 [Haemaphysalis longicornis]|uniref:Caspase family p20 domain-containing protein n=1 Tax=Haemaphysalis longicornis TaxID=44386 RepID=A0A9J6GRH6_HAELO|nr:hypothetical protein HPB48_013456 [Haemaphysalis longicornis]